MLACMLGAVTPAAAWDGPQTYRLYRGVTLYVANPAGAEFTVDLDVRDLNLFANGPREVLFKVYDPDGRPVVREIIPDDGVASANFPVRIGGWDHELQYYASLYAKGTKPSFRWSAWSEPKRLESIVKRSFSRKIAGGKRGVYRIVLVGEQDHYATVNISPDLKYGVAGHPTWMQGHGDMLKKSYVYVPPGTSGIFFAVAEPDQPLTRRFRLTAPDGTVLFDGPATGGYTATGGKGWQQATKAFAQPGLYDGKLLTLEVSEGKGDYLVKITLQQPKKGAFKDYVGMGSLAVYAPDPQTAMALKGGTFVHDGLVFWHPFQRRFHDWLKANKLDADEKERELRAELEKLADLFRLLEVSDGRGARSWTNWAYAFGYYGCRIWRPSWVLLRRADVPAEVKAIIREGLIMGGDRISFATGMERVNGNAFAQINVALWYCHRATGDALQKERFEVFWQRWTTEGWGPGAGLSKSGDSQEHFAHDLHYGSYLMDNWGEGKGVWVEPGIVTDATDDPRFRRVLERYRNLYTYLYCREQNGRAVAAGPWGSRTHGGVSSGSKNWEVGKHHWRGKPGPDLTVSVNGGDEWFAVRRKNYYMLTFHGRLAPEWMSRCFSGQLGFGGGVICQLTVPGKGPVLVSHIDDSYGKGMDPSNWRNFRIHSIVGEMWDGRPLISGISEHDNARLTDNTVASSGEVRSTHVKVARKYVYNPASIDCEVALAESDYAKVLSIWGGGGRKSSEVRLAYEMIPFRVGRGKEALSTVACADEAGKDLGKLADQPVDARRVRVDRGGYGVDIILDKTRPVQLGANGTVLIQLVSTAAKPVPASDVSLKYRLVPYVE